MQGADVQIAIIKRTTEQLENKLNIAENSMEGKLTLLQNSLENKLDSLEDQIAVLKDKSRGQVEKSMEKVNLLQTSLKENLCQLDSDNGGWIVIQRTHDGEVDFYRTWDNNKNGFGTLDTEFWLGNEKIHAITSTARYELRVDLKYNGQSKYARYDRFSIADERSNYKQWHGRGLSNSAQWLPV